MPDPITQTQKFEPERKIEEDLKIYFMISRPRSPEIPGEAVLGVLAYNLEDALLKANTIIPKGFNITFHGQTATVKQLINMISFGQNVVVPVAKEKPLEVKPRTTKQQFLWNLQMLADDFVKDEKDKKKLERIIKKVG